MQQWFDRPLVRHYRDGKCVWAGYDCAQTPKPTADTIIEKRPVGEKLWLRPVAPPSPFAALEGFVAAPALKKEEWSPTGKEGTTTGEVTNAEASVTTDGVVVSIESGKSTPQESAPASRTGRRGPPTAPRPKKSTKTPAPDAQAESVAKASGE